MKEKNNRAIIGIVVVASIILIMIGATFAYFSSSGGSANDAVAANAATLANLGFTSSNSKIATDLVPVASQNEFFSMYPGTGASGCVDDVGNEICSVYEFTVTNTASVTQTIYVSFAPSENTFDNMYFAAFNTPAANADYTVATGSSGSGSNFTLIPQTTAGNATLGHQATKLTKDDTNPIELTGLSTSLSAGQSVTYTILLWLQEVDDSQNPEQGKSFKAGVTVTTGGDSIGVTGVIGGNRSYVYRVSSATISAGSAIPVSETTYLTAASAMSNFGNRPFYLKHRIYNDILETSYVEFVVSSAMVSANSSMTAGTYTLSGGSGSSYVSNKSTLISAFGADTCSEFVGAGNITYFDCGFNSLGVQINDNGRVTVSEGTDVLNGWICRVEENTKSYCVQTSA